MLIFKVSDGYGQVDALYPPNVQVYEVRVWNKALTATEVNNYKGQISSPSTQANLYSKLVLY